MKRTEEQLWTASVDGELSAAEAAEFEQSLSPADRERLAAEVRLENALGECLRSGGECPDALWRSVQQHVRTAGATPRRFSVRQAVLAMAACLALVAVPAYLFVLRDDGSRLFEPASQDSAGALHLSEAEAATFLAGHDMGVDLRPVGSIGGHISRAEMMGARDVEYKGEHVVELYYVCCDKPLKILVAPAGGRAAELIAQADSDGRVQAARHVGHAVVAVVGRHRAAELLDVLTENNSRA